MKIILTNLFTTLWCQRKTNPRRVLFASILHPKNRVVGKIHAKGNDFLTTIM